MADRDIHVCIALFLPSPSLPEPAADKEANSAEKSSSEANVGMEKNNKTKMQNRAMHDTKSH